MIANCYIIFAMLFMQLRGRLWRKLYPWQKQGDCRETISCCYGCSFL